MVVVGGYGRAPTVNITHYLSETLLSTSMDSWTQLQICPARGCLGGKLKGEETLLWTFGDLSQRRLTLELLLPCSELRIQEHG